MRLPAIEKRRAQARAWQHRLKTEVLQAYGGPHPMCECCGEDDPALLCIDHVANDGKAHRALLHTNFIYPWLRKNCYPKGYQVLCFSCNMGKQLNGGTVCPAADAHLHLKFVRNIHPPDHQFLVRYDGGNIGIPIPYKAEGLGEYGLPADIKPIVLRVLHNPTPVELRSGGTGYVSGTPATLPDLHVLWTEDAYFEANRVSWWQSESNRGMFFLLKRGALLDVEVSMHETYELARREGLRRYGDVPMLIRRLNGPLPDPPVILNQSQASSDYLTSLTNHDKLGCCYVCRVTPNITCVIPERFVDVVEGHGRRRYVVDTTRIRSESPSLFEYLEQIEDCMVEHRRQGRWCAADLPDYAKLAKGGVYGAKLIVSSRTSDPRGDTQPALVGVRDVPGVSSSRDLPGPGETRVETFGRKA